MRLIGGGMARKMQNLCLPEVFTSHASCTGNYLIPDDAGRDVLDPTPILVCDDLAQITPCYRLAIDPTLCPGTDYLVQLDRGPASDEPIKPGTKLRFRCE